MDHSPIAMTLTEEPFNSVLDRKRESNSSYTRLNPPPEVKSKVFARSEIRVACNSAFRYEGIVAVDDSTNNYRFISIKLWKFHNIGRIPNRVPLFQ